MVGNLYNDLSICPNKVAINCLFDSLGRPGDSLVLQLNFTFAAFIVFGTNIAVIDSQCEDHVVKSRDVELEVFVPNRIQVAMLDGGLLVSIIMVAIGRASKVWSE